MADHEHTTTKNNDSEDNGFREVVKAIVNEDKRATIICPSCGFFRDLDTSKIKLKSNEIRVNCTCGYKFIAAFEYRKYYRKEVNLPGEYTNKSSGEVDDMHVKDLSQSGIRLELPFGHDVKVDDELIIIFTLDTPLHPVIKKTVKVLSVNRRSIGANFVESYRDQDLAFFLLP